VLNTTQWRTIRDNAALIVQARATEQPGSFTAVPLPRPVLRRRPFPPNPAGQS
jgi:hypothetical protein